MASRDEIKTRNIYNESLRRAQEAQQQGRAPGKYLREQILEHDWTDPSTTPFRGSGAGNLNQSIDTGKNYIGGLWGGAQRGLDALTQGVAMANENERWFKGNAPNARRYAGVPMNVRESVQTGRDKSFYDKYTKLARLAQDTTQKQYYLDQADTARRNLQITKRINYGLGQMDLDDTPFKGYESYHDGSRFDIDRFTEAMSEYLPGGGDITEDLTDTIISPDEIEDEIDEVSDLDLVEPFLENAPIDTAHLYPYHGRGELSEDFDYGQFPSGVDEVDDSIKELIYTDGTPTGYDIKGEKIIEETPTLTIEELKEKLDSGEIEIETGIFEDLIPSPVMQESNIIQDAVEKNPWIFRIMGNDYKYIRGWLWDLGVLNPNSDMYKKTDQLEQPK
jgi:hypothetical protein